MTIMRRAALLTAGLAVAALPSLAEEPTGSADGWGYVEVAP